MNKIELPEFKSYKEEATFWDNLDTGDFMEDDGDSPFADSLIR